MPLAPQIDAAFARVASEFNTVCNQIGLGNASAPNLIAAFSNEDGVPVGDTWAAHTFGPATTVGSGFAHVDGTDAFTVAGDG